MSKVGRRALMKAMVGASTFAMGGCAMARVGTRKTRRPNIVFILTDDLGWGDIGAYNSHSAIPTPNLDRLAGKGMRFNDMHSSSAVCTPSRYSILTGRYPWRSRLKKGAFSGYASSLIEKDRLTVAGLLKQSGYHTAGIGKWHLGLGDEGKTDYSKPFHPGPVDLGFDYYYGIPASLDMPPYVYFENDRVVAQPTETVKGEGKEELGGHIRGGAVMPGFKFEQVVPTLTDKAVGYIQERAASDDPFFLYFALPSPHNPWLPLPEYKGKSRAGDYGDYVYQTDAMVGKVLAAIEDSGLGDDTIVLFTSDNGAPWDDENINRYEHRANGDWRGRKSDIWEGGHRIPCLVSWPGHVQPGSVCDEMLQLTDFMATVAAIIDVPLPDDAAGDSFNMLPALEGTSRTPIRETMVQASGKGMLAIREGSWKLEMELGSGGFTDPDFVEPAPGGPKGQLYDLRSDPQEMHNVWSEHPEIVARLTAKLEVAQKSDRTRPN